jgi:hypothetical protein
MQDFCLTVYGSVGRKEKKNFFISTILTESKSCIFNRCCLTYFFVCFESPLPNNQFTFSIKNESPFIFNL